MSERQMSCATNGIAQPTPAPGGQLSESRVNPNGTDVANCIMRKLTNHYLLIITAALGHSRRRQTFQAQARGVVNSRVLYREFCVSKFHERAHSTNKSDRAQGPNIIMSDIRLVNRLAGQLVSQRAGGAASECYWLPSLANSSELRDRFLLSFFLLVRLCRSFACADLMMPRRG